MWIKESESNQKKKHYVAIIGAGVSGSEAAALLANQGINVMIIDQNALPYGKLEDGLPKWHRHLRDKQEVAIDAKLDHDNVRFVPLLKIGRDIRFTDLVSLGFTAVFLANGAWKDRPLPIVGIDDYKDKQLIYQNDLLKWYNHKHEPDYKGIQYDIKEGAVLIGGGLASLDVMKIMMMELTEKSLKKRFGDDFLVDQFEMEKKGLDKYLEQFDVKFSDLNIKSPTLIYRRQAKYMPLKQPQGGTQEAVEKARIVSQRILDNYQQKFHFNFIPEATPILFKEEAGRLTGLVLQKFETKENAKLVQIPGKTEVIDTEQVISSIGSIPDKIVGIPYDGDSIRTYGEQSAISGYKNVFAIGNAVTGKGNIKTAKDHGSLVTKKLMDTYLDVNSKAFDIELEAYNQEIRKKTDDRISRLFSDLFTSELPDNLTIDHIWEFSKLYQDKVGYKDYASWVSAHKPVRYETLIEEKKSLDK